MAVNTIWVYGELANGAPTTGTLELLTKARSLNPANIFVVIAGDASAAAADLGSHGANKVYAVDLDGALPGPAISAVMKKALDQGDVPDLILLPMTYGARDVASRLSVKLDRTVLTNNTEIILSGDDVVVQTPVFGGATLVNTKFSGPVPHIAMFRPKSFAAEAGTGPAADVISVRVPDTGATGAARVVATHVEATTGPKLDEAAIVVSGGRGLGEAGKYEMVESLAKLLKAAPGASRAIVDAGWVPYSYQVGQTGKVVKPTVYIACGISGATQHMVGMKGSKNIIAINKDKEAPIFGIADLGIVGDVHKVLPKLIEALQARG
jgi:electron transfer flavoprotein alpha subunit